MWLLVRDNALTPDADGTVTVAACPDSPDRGEEWRWRVRRRLPAAATALGEVLVETAEEHIRATTTVLDAGRASVIRDAGEEVVLVPLSGHHLVRDSVGPWERWLHPGDAFVLEGEETETVHLDSAPGPAAVAVVRLRTTTAAPLRWVP